MAQLVERSTLGFRSGHELMASRDQALPQALHWWHGACLGFSLSPSFGLSQNKYINLKKKKDEYLH